MAKPTQSAQTVPTVFRTSEKGLDGPWKLIEVRKESYSKKDGDKEIPGSLVTLVLQRCSMPKDSEIEGVLNGEEQVPGNPPRFTKGVNLPVLEFPAFRYDASATIKKPFWYMKLIKPYACEVPGSEMVRFWNAVGWNRKVGKDFAVLKTENGALPMIDGAIDHSKIAGPADSLVYLNLKFVPNGKYRAKNVIVGFSITPPDDDFADAELDTEENPESGQDSEEIDPTQPEAETQTEQAVTAQSAAEGQGAAEPTQQATEASASATEAQPETVTTGTTAATEEKQQDGAKPGKGKKPQ